MVERHPGRLVTIFGGSGFIGRHVVRELAHCGWRIRVAVRRPERANFLQPLGNVGQIRAVAANIRDQRSIAAALSGADAVVNLVGILAASGKQTFDAVQAEGALYVADAAKDAGIGRFIQMSAIGADEHSPSEYAETKGRGERMVLETIPEAVIVRPSIVFGPEDSFFNRFATLAKWGPAVPIVGGSTRFQPVFVGDVADFVAEATDGKLAGGTRYELGGPEIKTFRELMQQMLAEIGRKRMIAELPLPIARLQARLMSVLPNPPLTTDQIKLLQTDNVVSAAAEAEGRTFRAADIAPHSLAAILPTYLWVYRPGGQFAPSSA